MEQSQSSLARQMTTQEILDMLMQYRIKLRELGVRKIGIFGSYSRGEATTESDLDFLVTLEPVTFDNYMDTWSFLEDLFERKVDLVIERSLKPALRTYVFKDVIYVKGL